MGSVGARENKWKPEETGGKRADAPEIENERRILWMLARRLGSEKKEREREDLGGFLGNPRSLLEMRGNSRKRAKATGRAWGRVKTCRRAQGLAESRGVALKRAHTLCRGRRVVTR